MGKRSDFRRFANDLYDTPRSAILPLLPHLNGATSFAEPCAGHGILTYHLVNAGLRCAYFGDILTGQDALALTASDLHNADVIITNPPWTRELLHPLIVHLMQLRRTWLLFDSDWAYTQQAASYLVHCRAIVAVGRVRWIAGTRVDGKDNASWYCFDAAYHGQPAFFGRQRVMRSSLSWRSPQ